MLALRAAEVFTGSRRLAGHSVLVEGERIAAVVPREQEGPVDEAIELDGMLLAPGFLDLQVNGGGDVLFNDAPTVQSVRTIVRAHRRLGTTDLLPTFITGREEGMREAVAAVHECIDAHEPGVAGVHLEGPFLNPAQKGVHDPSLMRPLTENDVDLIPAPRAGCASMLTIAPELAEPRAIAALHHRGVRISAGHSDANAAAMAAGVEHGVSCVTHMFNVTREMTGRDAGLVGVALGEERVMVDLIVDGHHVDYATVRAAWRAKRPDGMILVSDAMPPVGGVSDSFRLGGHLARVIDGRCTIEDGTLAGAALDLATAVRNCVEHVGVPLEEALRMASTLPAAYAGLGSRLGRVAPGFDANLVVLDQDLRARATVVLGAFERHD